MRSIIVIGDVVLNESSVESRVEAPALLDVQLDVVDERSHDETAQRKLQEERLLIAQLQRLAALVEQWRHLIVQLALQFLVLHASAVQRFARR